YRLSAHGNVITVPPLPTQFPEHEAIAVYGNKKEFEHWKSKDPVARFRMRLLKDKVLTEASAKRIESTAQAEGEDAGEFALGSRARGPEEAPKSVYALAVNMAREMMYGDAIAAAIIEEMQRDPNVVFYGQNMAMTERDPMLKRFGSERVRIAPISETAEIGIGIGAAMTGLRPIVELWMSEFMLVAFDQVINEAPRLRYMSGGQVSVPLVLKAGFGFCAGWAGQHSNCIYHTMMGIPGLKVVVPSTSADAKGLMAAAIRDDNPVVYLHSYMLTLDKGEVPDGEYVVPLGVADIKNPGTDVTIVAIGWMVKKALAAAERLAE